MNATSLQHLHDIISPHPVAWLPPAPGWYALGFSLFLICSWFSVHKYLAWKRNKYRREALIELDVLGKELVDNASYQQLLPQLPQLVKRTAIAAYGRNLVAYLSGDDWLGFLDKTGSTQLFTKGNGRLLNACSYLPAAQLATFSREQVAELQKAVSYWIRNHQNSFQRQEIPTMNNPLKIICFFLLLTGFLLSPLQSACAAESTEAVVKQDYTVLAGEWQRTDGGYLVKVSNVQTDGKATVEYFNPRPIHVEQAAITTQEDLIKLFIKLQDKGYEGSTYTLYYYVEQDALAGFYYQAPMDKTYKVIFMRKGKAGN